ncbi:MAG: hypothetical protein ABIQ91_04240 [Candidatus Paceibacterota bacterium]
MLLQLTSKLYIVKKTAAFIIATTVFFAIFFLHTTITHALTISPARIEIAGDPGAVVGGEFTLINEQSTVQTYYVSYENFNAQGETGAPSFSADKTGLDTWLAVNPTQVTLDPGKAVKVPYAITIPANTQPGGFFAAIFWSTTPPNSGTTQLSIGAKVGVLILLRVNGEVTEKAGITQFDRNGHGFFYSALPVSLRYKFRNDGTDRVEPKGTITIRDTIFIPTAHLDANDAIGNVLPGSVRQFSVQWLKHVAPESLQGFFTNVQYQWQNFAIGLYSAHLSLAYGTQGLHTSKTIWFFVFPWQLVLCIVVLVLIVWKGGKTLLRRYNRYIIQQAQSRPSRDADLS